MRHVTLALSLLALAGWSVDAVNIRLRPQSSQIEALVQDTLKRLSSATLPLTLDKTSGTFFALGAAGSVAFNPDVSARTYTLPDGRHTEFNPQGPLPLQAAVDAEIQRELGLTALTPEAAQLRFSGADLNGDGKIDTADLAILMGNFGQSVDNSRGDLNNDGHVDDLDLRLFSAQYKLP